jgi:cell division protein FtsW
MNRRIDHWLILIVLILIVGGLLMVLSASAVGNPSSIGAEFKYLIRQSIALSVGLVLCTVAAITPIKTFRQYHKIFYILCGIGLLMCFIPGFSNKSHGAARWVGFGSVNFQPSAFAKIAILVSLAHYLHNWRGQIHHIPILIRAALIPLPLMFLILIEPDFGTTLIIAALCFSMLVAAGMRSKHILISFLSLVVVGIPVLIMEEYRLRRVLTFWDPWEFKQGEGYQIIQSWIAMHQGGLLGQGLGNSVSKRQFLPEPWTDFIAAVIAEEMGFIGITFVILLFCAFLWRGFYIASRARDAFSMFLATTLTVMITGEALFNLGVVMGMVPPKGLVLPFISYGASAMMANMLAVGILLSISAEKRDIPYDKGWKMDTTSITNEQIPVGEQHVSGQN